MVGLALLAVVAIGMLAPSVATGAPAAQAKPTVTTAVPKPGGPAVTQPAPRAGGFPLELAVPLLAGSTAALGTGLYILRRPSRR
jgi:hypothetical protein